MNLFTKNFAIINAEVSLKNYKKRVRRNYDPNKNRFDMFENNKNNANVKVNYKTTGDSDYGSNSI